MRIRTKLKFLNYGNFIETPSQHIKMVRLQGISLQNDF